MRACAIENAHGHLTKAIFRENLQENAGSSPGPTRKNSSVYSVHTA